MNFYPIKMFGAVVFILAVLFNNVFGHFLVETCSKYDLECRWSTTPGD